MCQLKDLAKLLRQMIIFLQLAKITYTSMTLVIINGKNTRKQKVFKQ